jgi:hypothetical protein
MVLCEPANNRHGRPLSAFIFMCSCHARHALQVLSQPVYMEDHVGVLEEEVTAGLVPVPALPKFKQVCGFY